ncbi:MAG: hypothetical protein JWN34_2250 [Bryobacterales bacterium]|nr:hypothetical protein [Bryobacterales bacterium]
MSPFDLMASCVISTAISVFGSSTNFTYSRRASQQLDAVESFAINAAFDSGGEHALPDSKTAGALLVRASDIPLGPARGDLVTIAAAPSPMKSGVYAVHEIVADYAPGWASLHLRYVGPA